MEQKRVTIDDIARTANVSKSTVSRVLNNSTPVKESKRSAVTSAMEKLNFQPNMFARGLAGGSSMTIGIVTQNIGSPFYDQVTQGIIQGLTGTEYYPIFVDGQWREDVEKAAVQTLIGRQVDGIIFVGGDLDEEFISQVSKRSPSIIVARDLQVEEPRSIVIDNFQAAYDATKYLVDLGHKEIAHITGIREHQDAIRRRKGYSQAIKDAGIPENSALIIEGNFSGQSGIIGVETLVMRGTPFTAIFAANDEMAFGARLGLYRKGIRVPEDVSIVGFDDQPNSAYATPPLTTVRQPAAEMGRAAAHALLDLLKGNDLEIPEFKTQLIIRESAAARIR